MTNESSEQGRIPTLNLGRNAAKRQRRADWERLRAVNVSLTSQHEPHKRAPKRKGVLMMVLLNKGIEYRNHTGGNN